MHVKVPEEGDAATGSQRTCDLRVGDGGIEPVEGGRGDSEVESFLLQRPCLERTCDDLNVRIIAEVVSGNGGQVLPKFDGEDLVTSARQRHRRLPRPAPDLQHAPTRLYARQGDSLRVEWVWII